MTMTVEEMKAAIAEAEAKARKEAEKLKAIRDKARSDAEVAHKAYVEFCRENNVPLSKGRPKGSKNKDTDTEESQD